MYKAIVLACMLSAPDQCWEFVDTRGPYRTFEACRTRAYEMGNAVRQIHTDMTPLKFRCEQLKGTEL